MVQYNAIYTAVCIQAMTSNNHLCIIGQVEIILEMKKWSRNGKVIKQGIGMCMMFSQCNTCSMVIYQAYDTISRGVWPHRGPCLLRFICP